MNHQHQRLLAETEFLRISNQTDQADTYYKQAITSTRTYNYWQTAALTNELTAKLYLFFGKERIAAGYMQEAYDSYTRLGVKAKTNDLTQRYPNLIHPILQQTSFAHNLLKTLAAFATFYQSVYDASSYSFTSTSFNPMINFATILEAAQNLSTLIQPNELLCQLTQIVLQNAEGERCALILPNQEGEWQVRVIATLDNTQLFTAPLSDYPHLPVRLIQFVKNTQDVVVIDNLKTDLPVIDEYLIQRQPKSLLCLPILYQGRLIGILYLKNLSASGVFTHDRILVLNFLCTQAAIALENAKLYAAEQEKTEKLQASEQRLKIIFEQASDAILLWGESGFIDCNQAALDLFQYQDKSQLLNLHPPQISPEFQPDGMSSVVKGQQIMPQVFARGSLKLEWVHQRSNGESFDAEVTLTAIPYQGGKIIHGLIRDISNRKRLEAEQQRLIDILEVTPDYVGIANAKGELIWGNQPLRSLRPDFNQMKHISEFQPAWANEIFLNQAIPAAIVQGSWSGELAILDDKGREIPISQVIVAHKSASGEVEHFSTIMRDVSDHKAYKQNLEQTNAELIRATRKKDEFLATMSHELRTPLNAILGMTQGLQEEIFGPINERQLNALNTVEKSSTHLLSLINDILDVAKIESGQVTLNYSPIDVQQLCSSSMVFVKQQALRKNIRLHTQIPQPLPELLADEVRIRQVLLNLLTNAVKFTPEGGRVTLSVVVYAPVEAPSQPTYLRFAVADTGIGIAPENIPKLFQPFIQIDSALNRQQTGTGLGLALVRQIVELHGGQVALSSELGVGSCFTVYVPHTPSIGLLPSESLPNAPEFERTASVVSAPVPTQTPLILLAEDNAANVATLSSYLQVKGYRLVYAVNGREAIDLSLVHQPDLILMDIQMPEFDGLEAIRQIRQQEGLRETPIIALTALAMGGDRERCLAAGANEYLSKPVKLKQLDASIKALLAERRPQ